MLTQDGKNIKYKEQPVEEMKKSITYISTINMESTNKRWKRYWEKRFQLLRDWRPTEVTSPLSASTTKKHLKMSSKNVH